MTAVDTPLIDVNDPRFYDDPWDAYRWMRDHSRVHWDANNELWVVSRHEDVSIVSRDNARYSAAGGVLAVNASRSGCRAGAKWCLHDALVTERPHNSETYDLERDYQGFLPDRPASVAYLSAPWDPPTPAPTPLSKP